MAKQETQETVVKTAQKKAVKTTQKTTCIDCHQTFEANRITKPDGTILLTPPRCPACQTAHLTNLRVNKTIKDLQLLGNLRARLTNVQREAVIEVIGNGLNTLLDRYSGSTIKASAFDLKKVKV